MRRWENSCEIFFLLFVFHLQRRSFHLAIGKMSWSGFEIDAERFGMLEIHFHYKSNHQRWWNLWEYFHFTSSEENSFPLISSSIAVPASRNRRAKLQNMLTLQSGKTSITFFSLSRSLLPPFTSFLCVSGDCCGSRLCSVSCKSSSSLSTETTFAWCVRWKN